MASPTTFTIETHLGCNLRCPECACGSGSIVRRHGHMPFGRFRILADKIRPHAKYVYLHNLGEPLLNKDILEIARYSQSFARSNIHTNGNVAMSEKEAKDLVGTGVDLSVSLDGMTQDVYERYRIGGDIGKVFRTIDLLRKCHDECPEAGTLRVQFVAFEHNQHQIPDFQRYCLSIGVHGSVKAPYFRGTSGMKPPTSPGLGRTICRNEECVRKIVSACPTFRDEFAVLLDGSVVPCCYDHNGEIVFGNLFDQGVAEIWGSKAYVEFRERAKAGTVPDFCSRNCLMFYKEP
jgi:MoaA/NifB/PqqE/SkfB family radical SAM enzyme